jgi:hypothetical protein
VPVLRRAGKCLTEHAIALVGQTGPERGLAFYEDPHAFDAMWSGEHVAMNGLSVLEDEGGAAVLTKIVDGQPHAPRDEDFSLAAASMRLLINLVTGEPTVAALGPGKKLELKKQTPPKPR